MFDWVILLGFDIREGRLFKNFLGLVLLIEYYCIRGSNFKLDGNFFNCFYKLKVMFMKIFVDVFREVFKEKGIFSIGMLLKCFRKLKNKF